MRSSLIAYFASGWGLLASVGCSDAPGSTDAGGGFTSAGGSAGADGASGGLPASTGGTPQGIGGSTVPGGGGGTATGGLRSTGGAEGPSGGAGGSLDSGGSPSDGGVPNSGGVPSDGGTGSGGVPSGGGVPSDSGGTGNGGGTSAVLCEAIGWATRGGRSGGTVAVTGGGSAAAVVVNSFSALQMYAGDDTPRVIHVDGAVGSGWSGTSGDRLEVGSNKTIVGLRAGTELKAPIHIKDSSNVIIRNLVIHGPGSNSDQAWDNLSIEGSSHNVWIDHCEFWDGQDGNADVVKGADNVTFTWNIFGYRTGGEHNFSNLVASSDDEPESVGKLNITFMFNWFSGVAQRQPRCRYGDIHVVNNLFTRDGQPSDYGISAGKDCRVLTEANHFIDINTPIYTSHASGSAGNQLRGDNIFENTSGNTTGFGTAFEPPYDYQDLLVNASEVKALVEQDVGATMESPDACN